MRLRPFRLAVIAGCLLTVLAPTVEAASPSVTSVTPSGGRRGTELEVSLGGARLKDAREVLFYQPGIQVKKLEAKSDGQVVATFEIKPECQLGLHELRLRTDTGISEIRLFSVGNLPESNETEPNNDFNAPQVITMNSTVNGVAQNEDVDFYVVEAKKGERISAEVEGLRLGISEFDPYVAIMDTRRFELAVSDDAALLLRDAQASILAPEDGKYIIQVRESAYAGNANCRYRLHVGNFPRPTAMLPAGGKLGEEVEVTWLGDVTGPSKTKFSLPAELTHNFGLLAQDKRGVAPDSNAFRLSPFGNAIEIEPNNDHASATAFTAPLALNGVIEKSGDVDHYVFKATKGQVLDAKVFARSLRSPLDSVLTISTRNGKAIASNDDSGGPDSQVRFTAPAEGEYVVTIQDQLLSGGENYAYRIEMTPVAPSLKVSVPSESNAIRHSIARVHN